MKLFHRSTAPSATAVRRPALVTHVDAPPQGAPRYGPYSRGSLRVMVDLGAGPVEVAGTFRFADDRWLVRGMHVTAVVDPSRPNDFDVDWGAVPSMTERVAANDPALADPFAAGRRVAHALGLTKTDTGTRRQDRFAELMAAATAGPAVPGKVRAVVLIASVRGRMVGDGSETSSHLEVSLRRSSEAVLAVNVPGRPPYAVLVRRFKFPARRSDLAGGGLPALVSATDRNDVEVQWSEMPSTAEQLAGRISASMSAAQDRLAAMRGYPDTYPPAGPAAPYAPPANAARVPGEPAVGAIPAPGAGFAALTPQVREMMIDNLRRTLRYVGDPAQRRMILDQYRALGLDVDSAGLDG